MFYKTLVVLGGLLVLPHTLVAQVKIATDIAPIAAIVEDVVQGHGDVVAAIPKAADPHQMSLRASNMQDLMDADLVFWVGPQLTPWMGDILEAASVDVDHVLLNVSGWDPIKMKRGERGHGASSHDHGHAHGAKHDKGHSKGHAQHDDHSDEGHETAEGGNSSKVDHHKKGRKSKRKMRHKPIDPHAWLDPDVAAVWAVYIGETMADFDPEHAEDYRRNAAKAAQSYTALKGELSGRFTALGSQKILWGHGAFHYLARAFELDTVGVISGVGTHDVRPRQLKRLREKISRHGVDCVVLDPNTSVKLLNPLELEAFDNVVSIDPLHTGPSGYTGLIEKLGDDLLGCAPAK